MKYRSAADVICMLNAVTQKVHLDVNAEKVTSVMVRIAVLSQMSAANATNGPTAVTLRKAVNVKKVLREMERRAMTSTNVPEDWTPVHAQPVSVV